MLAEICHGGYMDALHFLLERGEQLLLFFSPRPLPPGLSPGPQKVLFQVYSGGEVSPPAWPGCHAAKLDWSLMEEITPGWSPRSSRSCRSASGQVRGRSNQVACRPPEYHLSVDASLCVCVHVSVLCEACRAAQEDISTLPTLPTLLLLLLHQLLVLLMLPLRLGLLLLTRWLSSIRP